MAAYVLPIPKHVKNPAGIIPRILIDWLETSKHGARAGSSFSYVPHRAQEPPPVVKMDTRIDTEVEVKRHLRVCHCPYPSQTDGQDV